MSYHHRMGWHTTPYRLRAFCAASGPPLCSKSDIQNHLSGMASIENTLVECRMGNLSPLERGFPRASHVHKLQPTELSKLLGHPA